MLLQFLPDYPRRDDGSMSFSLAASNTAVLADDVLTFAALDDTEALLKLSAGFSHLSNVVVGCGSAHSSTLHPVYASSGAVDGLPIGKS